MMHYGTMPCSSIIFECVGDDELGQSIFEDEKDEMRMKMMMRLVYRLELMHPLLPLPP